MEGREEKSQKIFRGGDGRRTTRAQTNTGAVMGMDGNREERKITTEEINTEINTTINHMNKYNNQPREEDGESS